MILKICLQFMIYLTNTFSLEEKERNSSIKMKIAVIL